MTDAGPDETTIAEAIADVERQVRARLDELIDADVNEPRSGPLECVRSSLGPITTLLADHGAAPAERDPFDRRVRPDDVFGLGPMSFIDLGSDVHAAGIEWGATKAFLHRRRNMPPSSASG